MKRVLLILTCFIFGLPLITNAQATLKAHYKFDETSGTVATDASGNGYDADIIGTTTWVEGVMGGALEFGGDANVTIPATTMLLSSAIGSVSLWVNVVMPTGQTSGGIRTLFWAGDASGSGFGPENELHIHLEEGGSEYWLGGECSFFILDESDNGHAFLFSDPEKGTSPGAAPVNPILLGDSIWHHVVGTFGNGKVKLYIDGAFVVEEDYSPTGFGLTNMFLGQMGGGQRRFNGRLDDVRIYSGVLTEEEIIALNQVTPVRDGLEANPKFVLYENSPNPFNASTTIRYQLAENSDVQLTIYNQAGQLVRTLVNENQLPGLQSVNWDGRDGAGQPMSSGIYLYRLQVGNELQTKKLMLIK